LTHKSSTSDDLERSLRIVC